MKMLVADAIHFVRAGSFQIYRTAQDGHEQVLGFAVRGEVLGFEALAQGTHPSAAVALDEILDLTGLKQFALNTRRAVDEGLHTPGPQPELRLCAS